MMNKCFLTTCITYKILFQFSEGNGCSMNKFFYSTLFYSLLTCGFTSDLTLWTLFHPQPPELFQILRPTHFPLRPPPHARPPPLSTNRHPQVLLKSFLTTSAFQIVLSGEYLNCLTHLGVLIHFFLVYPWPPQHFVHFKKFLGGLGLWVILAHLSVFLNFVSLLWIPNHLSVSCIFFFLRPTTSAVLYSFVGVSKGWSYCPEPFRPIASYFPEPFRPITSCSRTCYWPAPLKKS